MYAQIFLKMHQFLFFVNLSVSKIFLWLLSVLRSKNCWVPVHQSRPTENQGSNHSYWKPFPPFISSFALKKIVNDLFCGWRSQWQIYIYFSINKGISRTEKFIGLERQKTYELKTLMECIFFGEVVGWSKVWNLYFDNPFFSILNK